jgi:hypothetical protein
MGPDKKHEHRSSSSRSGIARSSSPWRIHFFVIPNSLSEVDHFDMQALCSGNASEPCPILIFSRVKQPLPVAGVFGREPLTGCGSNGDSPPSRARTGGQGVPFSTTGGGGWVHPTRTEGVRPPPSTCTPRYDSFTGLLRSPICWRHIA